MIELNKIYNKDCLEFMKDIPNEYIDLIIADPPYFSIVKEDWDNQWETKDEYLLWCEKWINECKRILKQTGSMYIWGEVGEKSDTIIHIKLLADKIGLYFKDWITWKKQRGMGNRKGWLYTREELLWYVKNNKKFTWNEKNQYSTERRKRDGGKDIIKPSQTGYLAKSLFKRITNVWIDISECTFDVSKQNLSNKHLTPKPVELSERIIKVHTNENDLVYIPFAGSGSEIIACIKNKRNYIATEINNDYITNIIIPRIQKECMEKVI